MVHTYCISYGVYSDDDTLVREKGDILHLFSYWDHEKKIILRNAEIINISSNDITVKTEENAEVTVSLEKIESLDESGMSLIRMKNEHPDLFKKMMSLAPESEVREAGYKGLFDDD